MTNSDFGDIDQYYEHILAERYEQWEALEYQRLRCRKYAFKNDNWKKKYKPPSRLAEADLPNLPSGWMWTNLDTVLFHITDFQANGSFASLKENVQYFGEGNYAVLIRLIDLRSKLTKRGSFKYTDKHGYDFLSKSSLHGGEILVANVGAGVGTHAQMPKVKFKATLAPNMFCVYPVSTVYPWIYTSVICSP